MFFHVFGTKEKFSGVPWLDAAPSYLPDFCSALRKTDAKQDTKDEEDADMETKKDEGSGSDSDDEKKKDDSETLDVRDVAYNLEILTLCFILLIFTVNQDIRIFQVLLLGLLCGKKFCATTDARKQSFTPIIKEFRASQVV